MVKNFFKLNFSIKTMSLLSLLIALAIIVAIFGRAIVYIPIFGQFRISFVIIFLIIIGFVVNPLTAFIAGALVDLLAFFIGATLGTFHLGFTLDAALVSLISSLIIGFLNTRNKNPGAFKFIWFFITLILVFIVSILLLTIVPFSIEKWLLGIVVWMSSSIGLLILCFFVFNQKAYYINLVFIVFLVMIINTFLSSLWLKQLFGLPYSIYLWPRLIKNMVFDWWIISLIIIPLYVIVKKKNLLWKQKP